MFSLREWAGLLFKQAREDLGYSQQFVADELEIDIRTIKRLEAGNGNPDFRTLCDLFHLLHVSPDILFHAEQTETGLEMDRVFRQLLKFAPEQITSIYKSAFHIRSWYEQKPEAKDEYVEFINAIRKKEIV